MPRALFTVIASGFAVSGTVDLTKSKGIAAIDMPTVNSGGLFVRGSFDQTSANFKRLLDTRVPGSGDLQFFTFTGCSVVPFPQQVGLPPYLRLELAGAQTDNRTFTVLSR